jgi:hypothetical protein
MTVSIRRRGALLAVCAAWRSPRGRRDRAPAPSTIAPHRPRATQELAALAREALGAEYGPRSAVAAPSRATAPARRSFGATPETRRSRSVRSRRPHRPALRTTWSRAARSTPTTTVGALLPCRAARRRVTLETARHPRSGLPSRARRSGARSSAAGGHGASRGRPRTPHSTAADPRRRRQDARSTPRPARTPTSGFAVLGRGAGAAAADRPYPQLVTERVLVAARDGRRGRPHRAATSSARSDLPVRTTAAAAPTRGPGGHRARGGVRAPTSPTRPGSPGPCWSARPRGSTPACRGADLAPEPHRLGVRSRVPTRSPAAPVLWHNGGTGGFTSFLGVDRGRASPGRVVGGGAPSKTPAGSPAAAGRTR